MRRGARARRGRGRRARGVAGMGRLGATSSSGAPRTDRVLDRVAAHQPRARGPQRGESTHGTQHGVAEAGAPDRCTTRSQSGYTQHATTSQAGHTPARQPTNAQAATYADAEDRREGKEERTFPRIKRGR